MRWAFAHTLVTSQFVLGIGTTTRTKTPGPRVETEVVRPAHTGAKLSWSVFCREGGWGRKTPRRSMHKLFWYVFDKFLLFKDLGPRLPFEIGGVWTGDLSLCD